METTYPTHSLIYCQVKIKLLVQEKDSIDFYIQGTIKFTRLARRYNQMIENQEKKPPDNKNRLLGDPNIRFTRYEFHGSYAQEKKYTTQKSTKEAGFMK